MVDAQNNITVDDFKKQLEIGNYDFDIRYIVTFDNLTVTCNFLIIYELFALVQTCLIKKKKKENYFNLNRERR